ncbi:MAG: extracellular solute-binding protein [Eubacteriales bacterium]
MFKKLVAMGLTLSMVSTLFIGCGSTETATTTTTETATTETTTEEVATEEVATEEFDIESLEDVVLTYAMPQTQFKDIFQTLADEYHEYRPNITIEFQAIPDEQFNDLMQTKINLGEAPDILALEKGVRSKFDPENFVVFEDEPWQDRLIDGMDEYEMSGDDDGQLRTLIMQGPALEGGLLYNTGMFEKYGLEVPTTMDEFYDVCDALLAEGETPLYASDKDLWTVQIWACSVATQFMTEADYDLINANEAKWADYDQLAETIDTMAALRQDGYTNSDYLAATYDSALTAMAEEEAAMYVMGTWFIGDVAAINPDVVLGYAAIPQFTTDAGGFPARGGMSIWEGSENIEAAKDFMNWFSQPENMDRYMLEWGYYPAYTDQEMDMPEWQQIINDDFIIPDNIGYEIINSNVSAGITVDAFWGYQQEVIMGISTGAEALAKFDADYAVQAKTAGVEAFQ